MRVRVKVGSCDTDAKTFEASGERLTLGRNADCEVAVDPVAFPTVSGVHARVEPKAQGFVLVHLSLNNKTLLNDVPVEGSAAVRPGDRVRLGFTGPTIELTALGLKRVVQDRGTGKPLTLLDDINLVIRPREFVCLLGPSGSGKSTLLAILSGRSPPDAGNVTVNSEDLYNAFEALKEDIAVVCFDLEG